MPRRPDTVYIISHPSFPGEVKVGLTLEVNRYLDQLNAADPNRDYRLVYEARTDHPESLKKALKHFPVRSGWYRGDPDKIKDALEAKLGKQKDMGLWRGLFRTCMHLVSERDWKLLIIIILGMIVGLFLGLFGLVILGIIVGAMFG